MANSCKGFGELYLIFVYTNHGKFIIKGAVDISLSSVHSYCLFFGLDIIYVRKKSLCSLDKIELMVLAYIGINLEIRGRWARPWVRRLVCNDFFYYCIGEE